MTGKRELMSKALWLLCAGKEPDILSVAYALHITQKDAVEIVDSLITEGFLAKSFTLMDYKYIKKKTSHVQERLF